MRLDTVTHIIFWLINIKINPFLSPLHRSQALSAAKPTPDPSLRPQHVFPHPVRLLARISDAKQWL